MYDFHCKNINIFRINTILKLLENNTVNPTDEVEALAMKRCKLSYYIFLLFIKVSNVI